MIGPALVALIVDSAGQVKSYEDPRSPLLTTAWRRIGKDAPEFSNVASIEVLNDCAMVRVVPDQLSYSAYASVARLLEDNAPERIVLSWDRTNKRDEIIVGVDVEPWIVAGQRIMGLVAEARIENGDRFRLSPASIADVPSNSPLLRLIEYWRFCGGNFDLRKHGKTVSEIVNGQFGVIRSLAGSGQPVFHTLGPGWQIYHDRKWINRSLGRPLTDQPDVRYGQWIAAYLRSALEAKGPTVSKVEAIISDPTNGRRKQSNYTRLTLPLRLANGDPALLSTPHVSSITRF